MDQDYTTLSEYLHQSNANNQVTSIIHRIASSCKIIANKISRAGIEHLYGSTSITNFHGEEVKTLDVVSNGLFIRNLRLLSHIYGLVSEEDTEMIELNPDGEYIVTFDPLDGSSNIDADVNIGSIFGIYKTKDPLLPAKNLVAAGYCIYGSSDIFVIASEGRVNGFTLDMGYGQYVLTHKDIRIPDKTTKSRIYSVNEGNCKSWSSSVQKLVDDLKDQKFSARYIGSMVADIHRTLLYGGLFMYPASQSAPNGKLRYLYEVGPMSYIMSVAGGDSVILSETDGMNCYPSLEHIPKSIHERVPIFMGSKSYVDMVIKPTEQDNH